MQKIVVILAAISIVADGFDGQLIGFAIPSLMKEWGVTRGDFAPVVALVWSAWASGVPAQGCSPTIRAAHGCHRQRLHLQRRNLCNRLFPKSLDDCGASFHRRARDRRRPSDLDHNDGGVHARPKPNDGHHRDHRVRSSGRHARRSVCELRSARVRLARSVLDWRSDPARSQRGAVVEIAGISPLSGASSCPLARVDQASSAAWRVPSRRHGLYRQPGTGGVGGCRCPRAVRARAGTRHDRALVRVLHVLARRLQRVQLAADDVGQRGAQCGRGRLGADRLQPWRCMWRFALRGGDYTLWVSLAAGPVFARVARARSC